MNELKEAHFEFQKYGAFTNRLRGVVVYSYTNRFMIDGTNYQCEFAAESEEFRERGFLTITTNLMLIWVDKKHGMIPLGRARPFPPGL